MSQEKDGEEAQIFLVKTCKLSELSWSSQLQPPTWDKEARSGRLSNGLLTVTTDGKTTTLALPYGGVLFSGLHFYGWLGKQGKTPSPSETPLNTTQFQSLSGSVSSGAD